MHPVAIGFLVFFILHVILWRLRPSNSPRLFRLILLAGFGMLISLGLQFFRSGREPVSLCAILWTYLFVIAVYVQLYGIACRSVSITLLTTLDAQSDRPVAFDQLCKDYLASGRFDERIQVMHQTGLLESSGNSFHLTAKGRRAAKIGEALSRIFSGEMEG